MSEKITRQNYCPSLVELGGCPISGVFGITSHGEFVLKVFNEFEPTKSTLVKVAFFSNASPYIYGFQKSLTLPLWNYSHADFSYNQNGTISIALSEGITNKPIRMLDVQIRKNDPFHRYPNEIQIEVVEQIPIFHSLDILPSDPSFFVNDCYLTQDRAPNLMILRKYRRDEKFDFSKINNSPKIRLFEAKIVTRNKILYPHNEYSDQIITVYSTEKQSILCWWMLRPDQIQLPTILGGSTNQKVWKCINHCAIDRITSITSHALPGKCIQILTSLYF